MKKEIKVTGAPLVRNEIKVIEETRVIEAKEAFEEKKVKRNTWFCWCEGR